jgi:hypothetical protein
MPENDTDHGEKSVREVQYSGHNDVVVYFEGVVAKINFYAKFGLSIIIQIKNISFIG